MSKVFRMRAEQHFTEQAPTPVLSTVLLVLLSIVFTDSAAQHLLCLLPALLVV